MRVLCTCLCLLIAATLGGAPAMAEEAQKDPEKVVEEITSEDATVTGPSGDVEAATGEATPTENWFGCPPGKGEAVSGDDGHCRSEEEANAEEEPQKAEQ